LSIRPLQGRVNRGPLRGLKKDRARLPVAGSPLRDYGKRCQTWSFLPLQWGRVRVGVDGLQRNPTPHPASRATKPGYAGRSSAFILPHKGGGGAASGSDANSPRIVGGAIRTAPRQHSACPLQKGKCTTPLRASRPYLNSMFPVCQVVALGSLGSTSCQ